MWNVEKRTWSAAGRLYDDDNYRHSSLHYDHPESALSGKRHTKAACADSFKLALEGLTGK